MEPLDRLREDPELDFVLLLALDLPLELDLPALERDVDLLPELRLFVLEPELLALEPEELDRLPDELERLREVDFVLEPSVTLARDLRSCSRSLTRVLLVFLASWRSVFNESATSL